MLRRIGIAFTMAMALCAPHAALAQWPEKPIRFIVPYTPGGGTDFVARLVGQGLSERLKQPVTVENRPGGNTVVGTLALVRAEPNGYTVGMLTDSWSINPLISKDLPYASKDVVPVALMVNSPFILVAHPSLQVKSLKELVALAKARPGQINYAALGEGSPHLLAMEWLASLAGIKMKSIPYKGVAPALTDVAGGRVDLMFTGISSGLTYVRAGKLVGLATGPAKRLIPDIPPVAEAGYPEFDFNTWFGVGAPAGTPEPIVSRLGTEICAVLADRGAQEKLEKLGTYASCATQAEMVRFMNADADKYRRLVDLTGVKNLTQ